MWTILRRLTYAFLLSAVTILPLTFLLSVFLVRAEGPETAKTEASKAAAAATEDHPVLVELFTSEGCSSCPPADALLEKLDTQPIPGTFLVVLSEHVNYWDHDGWKDPNSSAALTDRQSSYERALGENTPYTPQFIVDGTTVLRFGDTKQFHDVIEKATAAAKISIRLRDVNVDAGNPSSLRAHIKVDASPDKHNAGIYVVVALNRVESQVLHGENGGRHLTHVAVVEQLTKVGEVEKGGKAFDQEVQLKLAPGAEPKNLRIVAFVQERGPGKVLGAALAKPVS